VFITKEQNYAYMIIPPKKRKVNLNNSDFEIRLGETKYISESGILVFVVKIIYQNEKWTFGT